MTNNTKHIIILLAATIVLSGCYNQRKATVQHGKAVATYPEIGALYCATTYPVKEKVIKGKDSITTDTIWGEGSVRIDTIISAGKPTEIARYIQLPGEIITNTIYKTDTIIREDAAKFSLCNIERGKAIRLLEVKTAEAAKFKKERNKWRLIAIGLMAVVGFVLFLRVRKMFAKK